MKKIKKLLIVIVLAAVGFVGYREWKRYEAQHQQETENPKIVVFGNVDIRRVALAFRAAGRITELKVEEGDLVQSGDLVAKLDSQPYEEEVALREAEVAASKAELDRLEAGYRPQEIQTAKSLVKERQATLKTLELEFERKRELVSDGTISRQSFDDIRARKDEAMARLESAREEFALREEGYRKEDIAQARAKLTAAQAQLEIANTRLEDTNLYAPAEGTVLTRVLEPGSIVQMGSTVLTLSLAEPLWVRAYIPEPEFGSIHPGMKAEVYTDSRPDKPYMGQIGFISSEAEFTPKNIETPDLRTRLVYQFRVVIENADKGLRQGMPVTVKLDRDQKQDEGVILTKGDKQ